MAEWRCDGEIISYLTNSFFSLLPFNLMFFLFISHSKTGTNKEMQLKANYLWCVDSAFTIYLITGVLGFLMYGYELKDTILTALASEEATNKGKDSFMTGILIIVNIAFLISATMSIPLMFFSLKKNFINSVIFCKKMVEAQPLIQSDDINSQSERLVLSTDADSNKNKEVEVKNHSMLTAFAKNIIIICLYISIGITTIFVPSLKTVSLIV